MTAARRPGRPRKDVPATDYPKIEAMAGYGLAEGKIAYALGMDPDTFTKRKREDPGVIRALEKGQALAEAMIGETLYTKAKNGDLGAIVWWEKTRANRVDSSQVRHADAKGENLPAPQVTVYQIPDNGRGTPLPPRAGATGPREISNGNGRSR